MDKDKMEVLFSAVSRYSGIKKSELVDLTNDKELDSLDSVINAIDEAVLNHKRDLNEQLKGKYTRQAHAKTERLLRDSFPTLQFDSNKQADIIAVLSDHVNTPQEPKGENNKISLSRALENKEILDYINNQKETYKNESLETFKVKQKVREIAIDKLKEMGANLSTDTNRRNRQIDILETEIHRTHNFIFSDNDIIVKDKEGERIYDEKESKFLSFDDIVKKYSPVDFVQQQNNIDTPPKPNGDRGTNANSFGFTADEMKKFNIKDFEDANREDPEKAQFIITTMEKNAYGEKS